MRIPVSAKPLQLPKRSRTFVAGSTGQFFVPARHIPPLSKDLRKITAATPTVAFRPHIYAKIEVQYVFFVLRFLTC